MRYMLKDTIVFCFLLETQEVKDDGDDYLTPVSVHAQRSGAPPLRRRHARAPRSNEQRALDVYNTDGSMYHTASNN